MFEFAGSPDDSHAAAQGEVRCQATLEHDREEAKGAPDLLAVRGCEPADVPDAVAVLVEVIDRPPDGSRHVPVRSIRFPSGSRRSIGTQSDWASTGPGVARSDAVGDTDALGLEQAVITPSIRTDPTRTSWVETEDHGWVCTGALSSMTRIHDWLSLS